jgi:hypothetical protein
VAANLSLSCSQANESPIEKAIEGYLKLARVYLFLIKVTIGLGILSVILLAAVIYLWTR